MSFLHLTSSPRPRALGTATAPSLTTQAATGIGSTSATGNGTLISDGGASISAMGFVWGLSPGPTLANTVVTVGTTTGAYTGTLSGLPPSTLIYYAAYATNAIGTSYGNDQSFTTGSATTVFSSTLLLTGVA